MGTISYMSRADWGADASLPRLGSAVPTSTRTEVHVHHTTAVDNDATPNRWDLNEAVGYQRKLQRVRPDLGLDIPYSEVWYVLENLDVVIMEGRGLFRSGAHTKGHNTAGIGWAVGGDFRQSDPVAVDAVLRAMENRLAWLRKSGYPNLGSSKSPRGTWLWGHRDSSSTTCPGPWLYDKISRVDPVLLPFWEEPATSVPVVPAGTAVMGTSHSTVDQAVAHARSRFRHTQSAYPWDTVETIVRTVWQVAADEGVRADLAFALMVHETGYFEFGNDVKPEQFNFGGIGATGGVPGLSFPTVYAGVRAVVRRMRMYAAGSAELHALDILGRPLGAEHWGAYPTIEQFGGVWAVPGVGYGEKLVRIADAIAGTQVDSSTLVDPLTPGEIAKLRALLAGMS